jgi:hypothetical protein
MSQKRITRQRRTASAGRREQVEPELPLDPRDPDIVRVKQLRRPSDPRLSEEILRAGPGARISA